MGRQKERARNSHSNVEIEAYPNTIREGDKFFSRDFNIQSGRRAQ
jgi:hypothetical protein